MRPRTGWLALAATLTWGMSAAAAPPDADRLKAAADEFDSGRRSFKLKEFEEAAIHFENADRDAPSPEALLSAIRARTEAGHTARAATLAALALSRYPMDKTLGDHAQKIVSDSERLLHRVGIACSPDCALIVDNKVMPFAESANAVVYLDPGQHVVAAGWSNNRHKNADVMATAGGASRLSFTAPPLERQAASPSAGSSSRDPDSPSQLGNADTGQEKPSKSGLPPLPFLLGAGATVVLGGVTVWSGIDTINNPGKDRVENECPSAKPITDCELYQQGIDHQRRTNILIAATSVVGVTTALVGLFFTRWGGDEPAKLDKNDALLLPVLGVQDGVSIGAMGRF